MRVVIVGSCVTRDAFNLPNSHVLVDYIARTSLASAFSRPLRWMTDERLSRVESNFQRRLVEIDARKMLQSILESADFDVLLLDLIDERFSLVTVEDDVATYSAEMAKTEIGNEPAARLIKPNDESRLKAWSDGLGQLAEACKRKRARLVLNKVWWADADDSGEAFNTEAGNEALGRLYSAVPATFERIEYPKEMLVGCSSHRWGRSPFHYKDGVYRHLLQCLDR